MSFKSIKNEPPARNGRKLMTIEQCWNYFRGEVIPKDADADTLRRARMVFFAGAAFMMDQNIRIGEDDISEDVGAAHLEALAQELNLFAAELALEVAGNVIPDLKRRH